MTGTAVGTGNGVDVGAGIGLGIGVSVGKATTVGVAISVGGGEGTAVGEGLVGGSAQGLIDAAGALTPPVRGILTNSGSGSVFMGMRERDQVTRKREWEDCEQQLRALDFVRDANVGASAEGGAFSRSDDRTVAVTLSLSHGYILSRGQARTVAALVSRRFGIPTAQVVVADQDGRLLYGAGLDEEGFGMTDAYDIKRRYDADMESKVNGMLSQVFGEGTAYAMIDSTWSYDTTESLTETYDPENKVTSTDYSRTERSTNTDGAGGGLAHLGMGGQSQVIVGAQHQPGLAVDGDLGAFGIRDGQEVGIETHRLGVVAGSEVAAALEEVSHGRSLQREAAGK